MSDIKHYRRIAKDMLDRYHEQLDVNEKLQEEINVSNKFNEVLIENGKQLVKENKILRDALGYIKKHMEVAIQGERGVSAVWLITTKALEQVEKLDE